MTAIEEKMYVALKEYISKMGGPSKQCGIVLDLANEVTIGAYRVDFVISSIFWGIGQDGNKRLYAPSVFIECDGHKWHNLTPNQVSYDRKRDRWFAANGLTLLRFPGRDIWRDAELMALQAWGLLGSKTIATLASLSFDKEATNHLRKQSEVAKKFTAYTISSDPIIRERHAKVS